MANFYLANTGSGTDATNWAGATENIGTSLFTDSSAGDNVFVDSAFVEGATSTLSLNNSNQRNGNPTRFVSVDRTGDPEPPGAGDYQRGALVDVSGVNNSLIFGGGGVFVGIDFSSGAFISHGVRTYQRYIDCKFILTNTTVARYMQPGATDVCLEFIDCEFDFRHVDSRFRLGQACRLYFRNCKLASTSAAIHFFFQTQEIGASFVEIDGFDFSAAASDFRLNHDQDSTAAGIGQRYHVSGVSWPATSDLADEPVVHGFLYTGRGLGSEYGSQTRQATGSVDADTTTVLRSTYDDTNLFSYKMVASTRSEKGILPLEWELGFRRLTANPTVTVEVSSDDTLTDQEFWVEVHYPESGGNGNVKVASSRNADYFLGAGTTLSSSGETWTAGKTNNYTVSVTVSGGEAGVHRVSVSLATGSAKTVYVDGDPAFS